MGFRDLWQKSVGGEKKPEPETVIENVQQLRRLGRLEDARQQLTAAVQSAPEHLELNRLYWDVCVQLERPADAKTHLLRALRALLRSGRGEEAVFAWFELLDRLGPPEIDLDLRCRLAEAMLAAEHGDAAATLLEDAHEMIDPMTPLAVQLRLARASIQCRGSNAKTLADEVMAQAGVPDNMRESLERALHKAIAEGLRQRSDASLEEGPIEVAALAQENRRLKVASAVPHALDGEKLTLELAGGQRRGLALRQIQAVAAVRLEQGEGDAYVLIDLLLDSLWSDLEELRTVRLRTRDFDPQQLIPTAADPHLALGTFLANILASSQAQPLPDAEAAVGRPFHAFSSITEYERRVLDVSPHD